MKLIDADALKEAFRFADTIDAHTAYLRLGDVLSTIDEAPTIEAEPVKHGRWATLDDNKSAWRFYCSACGCAAYYPQPTRGEKRHKRLCPYNFCPNCGAKMDGEA